MTLKFVILEARLRLFIHNTIYIYYNKYISKFKKHKKKEILNSLTVAVFVFLLIICVRTEGVSSDHCYTFQCLKNLRLESSLLSSYYCLSVLELS